MITIFPEREVDPLVPVDDGDDSSVSSITVG